MIYWSFEGVLKVVIPLLLVVVWCWYQWKYRKLLRLAKKLPTIRPTLPVLGHLLHSVIRHRGDVRDIFKESCVDIPVEAAIKGVQNFCLWIGPTPIINTLNPDDIKTILTSSKTLEKTYIIDYIKFAIGDGLLTASTSVWKPTRRHIQPLFHSRNLNQLMPSFNRQSRDLVKRLADLDNDSCENVLSAVYPLATLNALDLVFGSNFKDQENQIDTRQILNFVKRSFRLWTSRILYFWLHYDSLFKLLNWKPLALLRKEVAVFMNPANKELQKRLKKLQTNKENTELLDDSDRLTMTDAFASLILSNSHFTEDHFQHNVCTIMAGGIDTTSITLSTCLLLLAMHPEIQAKVYEEVTSVFRGVDEDLYIADLRSLTYTEQVLKETMRLFPIFPAVFRKVSQDIKLSFGVLPAGSMVAINIFGVHRNPTFFPEPFKFNPEHFSFENSSKRPAFAYIPFSAGPRNCIGKNYSIMSMKTTLAHILRKYRLSTKIAFSDIQLTMNVELTIKNGFPIQFHKIKTSVQ